MLVIYVIWTKHRKIPANEKEDSVLFVMEWEQGWSFIFSLAFFFLKNWTFDKDDILDCLNVVTILDKLFSCVTYHFFSEAPSLSLA